MGNFDTVLKLSDCNNGEFFSIVNLYETGHKIKQLVRYRM